MKDGDSMDQAQLIIDRLARIETKIDNIGNAREIAINAERDADIAHKRIRELSERVERIENNGQWLWRTVAGAVLIGIINLILKVVGKG